MSTATLPASHVAVSDGPDEGSWGNVDAPSSGLSVEVRVRHLRDLLAYERGVPTRTFAQALHAAQLPGRDLNLLLRELRAAGWVRVVNRADPEDRAFARTPEASK